MTEFEQNLFIAVAKTIKGDNADLQVLSDKVMAEVQVYCDKHKKGYKALNDFQKERLTNVRFVLGEISKIKYTKEQLNNVIENNLKRVPGNLADKDRREELYNVIANLNFKCIYSDTLLVGGGQKIHLDHIIPVNLGGPTDDWNILPICGSCNSSKSDSHLLDWWEKEHTPQDEHKLVYIFEYMANRLLKSLEKGVKVVTTLTDDEIRKAIELENAEKQQASRQNNIDLEEDDIEDDYEDIEEVEQVKDEKIKRLDCITFLYQLLNHIKQNKQYIITSDKLDDSFLDDTILSEKDKQRLIDKKFKKLEKLFNQLYKQNKKLTGVKTDIQLLDEQRKMVEYIKSLDIVSYYHISYTYFDELQQMLDQGKTDKEIQEFCNSVDRAFNFNQFYNELMAYKEDFGNLEVPHSYINKKTGYKLGKRASDIREGKKAFDEWNELKEEKFKINKPRKIYLTNEQYKKLTDDGFIWDATIRFNFEEFYNELMLYKKIYSNFEGVTNYTNLATGYKLGSNVSNIRHSKKILDEWNMLSEEEKVKIKKPTGIFLTEEQYKKLSDEGFEWDSGFDYEEFYKELMIYKNGDTALGLNPHGNLLVPYRYINKKTEYHLGQIVSSIRKGKKALDFWNKLSEEEKAKTERPRGIFLTEEQYEKIADKGFVWEVQKQDKYGDWFTPFYERLQQFIIDNGKYPNRYAENREERKLAELVSSVRQAKQGKGNRKLEKDMPDKLDAIHFAWTRKEVKEKIALFLAEQGIEQGLSA